MVVGGGPKEPARVYRSASAHHSASQASDAVGEAALAVVGERHHLSASPTYIGEAVSDALPTATDEVDLRDEALAIFGDDLEESA